MTIRNKNYLALKQRAGRLGGIARVSLHGNPGTKEGRAKGGSNSLQTHYLLKTGFKTLQEIRRPPLSEAFAEFMGIVIGDGHLDKYQVTVTTNSITDLAHARHVKRLARSLFGVPVSLRMHSTARAISVVISSKKVCDLLAEHGMPLGSKLRLGVIIPDWIQEKSLLKHRCIRGLFDTDGCVFQDTHRIGGKTYRNVGMAFANNEPHVLEFFLRSLIDIGLHPTQTSKHRVFLRRSREIEMYFKVVGTSNPKHYSRFMAYHQRRSGGVG